jgi:hypothetical protein
MTGDKRETGNAYYARETREFRARSQPRRGLKQIEAAIYVGVSVDVFDSLVKEGLMPEPRLVGGQAVWDIDELDAYFAAFPKRLTTRQPRLPRQ